SDLRAFSDFEYENEVEVKKGFLTGREERETGRKVVSDEEFERIRQTVSSAHDVRDDYEQIRETDVFKETEVLKMKNINYAVDSLGMYKKNKKLKNENEE